MDDITAHDLLHGYANGIFPMADSRDDEDFYWYDPEFRGQLAVNNLHIPKKLQKTIKKKPYKICINRNFKAVINSCAGVYKGRNETWINDKIENLFCELHEMGFAHSIEAYDEEDNLVGGLYGLSLGGTFCGESMFSTKTDASKICLVYLTAILWKQGFDLLDTQFVNDHLKQFGVYEISRLEYKEKLSKSIHKPIQFLGFLSDLSALGRVEDSDTDGGLTSLSAALDGLVLEFVHSITQTSKIG